MYTHSTVTATTVFRVQLGKSTASYATSFFYMDVEQGERDQLTRQNLALCKDT